MFNIKEEANKIMKITGKFLVPILVLLILAIGGSGLFNYYQSKNNIIVSMVHSQLDNSMNSVVDSLKSGQNAIELTKDALDSKHIALTKSIAQMINGDKSLLDNTKLVSLAKDLGVTEIHVVDAKGKIAYSSIKEFVGFDFNSSDQTKPFLKGINDKNFTLAQEATPRGTDKTLFQYIGAARIDEPGIVQIGLEPKTIEALTKQMDVQVIVDNTRVGETGFAYALDKNGIIIAHKKKDQIGKNLKEMDWAKPIFLSNEGNFRYVYEGEARYSSFKKVGDMTLAVVYPDKEIQDELNMLGITTIFTLAISIVLLAVIIFVLVRRVIVKPLSLLGSAMKEAGEGNLASSMQMRTKDEIGSLASSYNVMLENMKKLIMDIKESSTNITNYTTNLSAVSEQMSASSTEVAEAIHDVANGAGGQAADLVQITGILSDFGASLEKIVEMSTDANKSTSVINIKAKDSDKKMAALVSSIGQIGSSFEQVSTKINGLGVNIKKINDITNVINSIADQTNLLALNAAIEAARAGESGRGFAVVADEIRKLAEQSKLSSEDISKMVGGISLEADGVVEITCSVNEDLEAQVRIIEEAIASFKEIIDSIEETLPKIEHIADSAIKIDKEKEEIIEKVETTSSVAEETSASSEEIAASAQEMSASSEEVASVAQALSEMNKVMEKSLQRFSGV
jgi:methyl-accepting chemotaxis protein